jgi:N-methylhydantoinase B
MTTDTQSNNEIDPFLLEIIRNGFDAIADDMALTLMRTSYSGIIRDSMDFSTAVCDAMGQTWAQGLTTPMHLGSFFDAMQTLTSQYAGNIHGGDIFIGNDPYLASGQHLPDIYIIQPVFVEAHVVAWATTVAHHSDVGGIVAGSNAIGATEIYQEGLRLPFLKFVDRGIPVQAVWDIVAANVRTPDKVIGDLQAQMAACATAERELQLLFERYGVDTVGEYGAGLHDYAERLARSEISKIPDGTYRFTDHIDGIGDNPIAVVLQSAVTIACNSVSVDWTGSSPQVDGGINSPLPFTKACAFTALRSIFRVDIPNCHGYTRAIEVVAPIGSITNPRLPGPCGARGITGYRMIDCLFGALSKAVPERVSADGSGGSTLPTISGYWHDTPFVFCETFMGTWGGTAGHDGQEGVPHIGANQSNVPVEMIETEYPLRIEQYGFVADTGGPGRFRGGLSLIRDYRVLCERADLNVRSDKRLYPPHGLFGGKEGAPSTNHLNPDSDNHLLPVLLSTPIPMKENDVFRHIMAGGGGYGDPLERLADHVLADMIAEKVTISHAAEAYGVVITDKNLPAIDEDATRTLRDRMRVARKN